MKNKRRFIKRESYGITLIALVITIIVLLILAGVSISMLTGNNGILTQAQNAKNKTEEAEEKERIQLAITEAQLGDGGYQDLTEENLQKEIDEEFGSGEVMVVEKLEYIQTRRMLFHLYFKIKKQIID